MKKNILILGPYLPGKAYGGPVKSILNMVETLGDYFNFYIMTYDRDLNSLEPYPNVKIGSWNTVGKAMVFYIPEEKELKYIMQVLKELDYDLIYTNSFFAKQSVTIQILKWLNVIKKPIIVAPRGELSQGALSLKSFKKRLFIMAYKILQINKSLTYTCTSLADEQDIINIFGHKAKIFTAGNIVNIDNNIPNFSRNKTIGQLKIATISRISRIKNIDYSLRILKKIDTNDNSFKEIIFDIYGPIEDADYWNECLAIIGTLSKKVKINYKGAVDYNEVTKVLSKYHIFLFPTKGENFGHVIQEAYLSGCPTIISDQTPWRKLRDNNIGFDISLGDQYIFVDAIKHYLYMDDEEYTIASSKAFEYGVNRVKHQLSIKENRDMFNYQIKK